MKTCYNFLNKIKRSAKAVCSAAVVLLSPFAPISASAQNNVSLDRLEIKIDGRNVVQAFSSQTYDYELPMPSSGTTLATLSAAPTDSHATVDISVNGIICSNHSLATLQPAGNVISYTVKNGSDVKTYTVKLNGSVTPPPPTGHYVYLKNTANWASPTVWAWNDSENSTSAGAWPGDRMTADADGYFKWTLPEGKALPTHIIFSDAGNSQTGDLAYVDYKAYDCSGNQVDPPGPKKPSITVSPASGKVKGTTVITVTISNDAVSASGMFNGKELTLSTTSPSTFTVSDFINDGQNGVMTITASNAVGVTDFSTTFTRDDSEPVITLTDDWRSLSIYQIMVGSFQHGEGGASGYSDMWGPEGHRKNGNLRGIINALDYIQELGMNAIWLTPVFDSSTGGHGDERLKATGYFCNDYFKIDPHFGTEAEFDELIAKAHERGIYVILDGVFGHMSNCTGASPSGNRVEAGDNVDNVRHSETGNIRFPGSLPYFKEVIRYWMNRGVDGWRLDQCYQVYQGGHNYWNDLRLEAEAVAAERRARGEQWGTLAYMVGEDWTSAGNITTTQQDGLKSVMDFDGKDNLVNLSSGVGSIGWFLSNDAASRGYRDQGVNPTIFLSNHDTGRVGDNLDVNSCPEQLMTRHAAVAAYSGPTCTYYGDEIGDKCGNGNADNKARTSGRISGFNQNEQRLHDYVAKVFKARAENPALWRGTVERQQLGSDCEVITKTDAQTGNKVICIFSQTDRSVSIGGTGLDLLNGNTVSGSVNVSAWIPAFIKM